MFIKDYGFSVQKIKELKKRRKRQDKTTLPFLFNLGYHFKVVLSLSKQNTCLDVAQDAIKIPFECYLMSSKIVFIYLFIIC